MRFQPTSVLLSLALLAAGAAQASQDRILPVTEIRLSAAGIDDTGPVTVTAKVDDQDWKALQIEAYGKRFTLDDKQLAALKGFPPESLRITYGRYERSDNEKAVHIDVSKSVVNLVIDALHPDRIETTRVWLTLSARHGLEMESPAQETSEPNTATTQLHIIELH